MRDESITIAKGIGILLVVLAHASCPDFINRFIVMFHMPFFFFVSGYCFKDKYLQNSKKFIVNRIRGLYIPYIKWSLFFLLLHNFFFPLNIYNEYYGFNGVVQHLYTKEDFIQRFIYITTRMVGHDQLLGGYWFLKQLFLGSIIALFTLKFIKSERVCCTVLLLFTLFFRYFSFRIPFIGIDSLTLLSSVFYMSGRVFATFKVKIIQPYFLFVFAIFIYLSSVFFYSSIRSFTIQNIFPYYISGILGSILLLNVGRYINCRNGLIKRFLVFTGDNTLNVLTWHMLSFKVVSLVIILIFGLDIKMLACFPVINGAANRGFWLAYFSFGALLPLVGAYLSLRFKDCFAEMKS